MELVKSGVTDMEEKVIHLINHISLTHLVHFINHTNLTQAYITYKSTNCTGLLIQQTWALYQISSQAIVLLANLLVEHLEHLDSGAIPIWGEDPGHPGPACHLGDQDFKVHSWSDLNHWIGWSINLMSIIWIIAQDGAPTGATSPTSSSWGILVFFFLRKRRESFFSQGFENSNARALVVKGINVLLTLLQASWAQSILKNIYKHF